MIVMEFDSDRLTRVETEDQIRGLSAWTDGIFVVQLTNEKLQAIAKAVPELLHLIADGNSCITDEGLNSLSAFERLESLDLEWSQISDAGLEAIAAAKTLRWVDLGFCRRVTESGVTGLRLRRPELDVVFTQV